jgi:hypothetical protein
MVAAVVEERLQRVPGALERGVAGAYGCAEDHAVPRPPRTDPCTDGEDDERLGRFLEDGDADERPDCARQEVHLCERREHGAERSAPEEADDDGFGGQMTVARAREREQDERHGDEEAAQEDDVRDEVVDVGEPGDHRRDKPDRGPDDEHPQP